MRSHATAFAITCAAMLIGAAPASAQTAAEIAACEAGDLAACNSVGFAHGVAGRHADAARYFERVCDGGEPVGCSNLAEFYFDGLGVRQDLERARSLWLDACNRGVTSGCAGLCIAADAQGRSLSPEEASACQTLVSRACAGGNTWMCGHRAPAAAPRPGPCGDGVVALGNAYVRANALYALYFGRLPAYVDANRAAFAAGGDAVRCAQALSAALFAGAVQTYDPAILEQRRQLDAQLGSLDIRGGNHAPTQSEMLHMMGRRMAWLGRVLPAAAQGDYGPMFTPVDELQRMEMVAGQALEIVLGDPDMRAIFQSLEGMIREVAEMEYRLVVEMARGLETGQ